MKYLIALPLVAFVATDFRDFNDWKKSHLAPQPRAVDPDIDPSYVRCSTITCVDHGGHTWSLVTQCHRGLTPAQCTEVHNIRVQSAIQGHTVSVDPCQGPSGPRLPHELALAGLSLEDLWLLRQLDPAVSG